MYRYIFFISIYELKLRMNISNKATSPAFAATLPASEADLVKVVEHPFAETKVAVSLLLVSDSLTPTLKLRVKELPEGTATESENVWLFS